MKKIKFESLRFKMLLTYFSILAFMAGVSIFTFFTLQDITKDTEIISTEEVPLLIVNEEMAFNAAQRMATIRGYLMFEDTEYLNLLEGYTEESERLHEDILANSDSEKALALVETSREWTRLIDDEVIAEHQKGNEDAALKNVETHNLLIRDVMNGFNELSTEREGIFQNITNNIMSDNQKAVTVISILSVIALIFGIGVALITSRIIVNPIIMVMDRMKEIADGKLDQEPLETNLHDEVGQLVVTTNVMNETVRNMLRQVQDVSVTVDSQSEELALTSNEVSQGAEQIAATMQELASGSEVEAGHASALSNQMDSFTDKIETVNKNSQFIQESSDEVLNMSEEGSKQMDGSLQQMNVIYEMVRQSVTDVEGLDQHTNEISQLVGVIQDIANQTNLLALNAAIEAASAGEQGRGFAVVAEEVRKLAEEVSSSVIDITEIVDGIQTESQSVVKSLQKGYEEVARGTDQLADTGQTFTSINDSIVEVVSNIEDITGNLVEVAGDAQDMNGLIEEIAAISEESAAGIEETTASSEETNSAMEEVTLSSNNLSKLAEELNALVQQFEL